MMDYLENFLAQSLIGLDQVWKEFKGHWSLIQVLFGKVLKVTKLKEQDRWQNEDI